MAQAARPERAVYEAGGGRKTALSVAFLVLLPFYASLPAMLIWRLVKGQWLDTIGLMVFSTIFTAVMAILGVQLYHALRSRIELGETAARITLPQGRGATPMLRFVNRDVPYEQVAAVETRCVLFGGTFAPVLLRATRLLLKDGSHIRLGNVYEDDHDPAMPFPEIAHKIAERASAPIHDGGTVRRSIEKRLLGLWRRKSAIEDSPPLTETDVNELNGRHTRAMRYLVIVMAVLIVGGIAMDVLTAPRTSFAIGGAGR